MGEFSELKINHMYTTHCAVTTFRTQLKTLLFVLLSDYVVTVELLPDSALVALRRFCAIQMAVITIIIILALWYYTP